MNAAHEICENWQSLYCAGSPMPKYFRKRASEYFSFVFQKTEEEAQRLKYFGYPIYRVISPRPNKKLLYFDDLYYSFSSDLCGVSQVATKDKNMRCNLFLIIARPTEAVDFNKLGNELFEYFDKTRYYKENEIVSKLSFKTIDSVYYLKDAEDIMSFQQKGVLISNNDLLLNIKKVVNKYNLPMKWLMDN